MAFTKYNVAHVGATIRGYLLTRSILRNMSPEDREHLINGTSEFDPDDYVDAPRPE